RQPLACVDTAARAKLRATDTVALAHRPSDSLLAARTARTARSFAQAQANLKRVHDAGIPIALGTDAGNPLTLHGASVFMELEAMQASGLTPRDVLVAATANAARALGLDSTGTISAGATADLVVLDADPPADLRGFTAESAKAQRDWEAKFRAIPSPDSLREYMRHLSARPHHVGSPYDKDNADWILAKFKSFGLDARIETFDVLFPTPKERV